MTVVIESRNDFTLETFRRVAWEGEPIKLGAQAIAKMEKGRRTLMGLIESDPNRKIYGVTTGFGDRAKTVLDAAGRKAFAKEPPYNKGSGMGRAMPDRVVRGMILTRLTNFVDGFSGIRASTAQQIADMLDGRKLPVVPMGGQTNSGEVPQLLNLFWHLIGDEREEKEANCIENGSPCATAVVADTALRARNRASLINRVFALSIEACNAPLEAYDPALKAMWGDEHESSALDALNALLAGGRTSGRRAFQAPVSWRIIPRVLGQTHRAVAMMEEVATVALRAVTDSPVILPPDDKNPVGRAFSTGGFHNGSGYPATNWLCAAWADLTTIVSRQGSKLLMPEVSDLSRGLTAAGSPFGVGFRGGQRSFGQQARDLARTSFFPIEDEGSGQTDVAFPAFAAYEKELAVGEALDTCLALLAIIASQALWVAKREPAPDLLPFLAGIRALFAPVDSLRNLGLEAEVVVKAFGDSVLSGDFSLNGAAKAA